MKFSEQWLREWVSPELTTQALADQITMAGLEVDAVEPVASAFRGVVVAEVVDRTPHPDADKLNVCRVDDGSGEDVQVVCGASNVAVGQKVPFARVGAVLPGDFKIKKAKLRGVESRGMICSASELGLEEETSAGILELPADAPAGKDFREWMKLDDHTIEVDLTPNRGDCLSLKGMAREVGVLNRLALTPPEASEHAPVHDAVFPVHVEAPERCPRYVGRVVRNVDVTAPTPLWMVERLRRSGVRSIDPVVDITNYVMLELGQPMHAFDLANLSESIVVRPAQEGETLVLLDGQSIALREDTLIIADRDKPLAIAGVMGGEYSGVSASTRDVFLESAFFTPLAVAGLARSYGLHTDASHRFERGVDPALTRQAVERATALLLDITGGEPGPLSETASPDHLPVERQVLLRAARIEQCLNLTLPGEEVVDILERLGMRVVVDGEGSWLVTVPSWRFDVAIEEDLIEELARIYGYNRLPVRRPSARLGLRADGESRQPLARLRRQMVARGYQEAISYSFVAPDLQALLAPDVAAPQLANPISSDMSVMRASLFPGLVKALMHNLNRQQQRVRLFETGLVFRGELDDLEQSPMLGGLICGTRDPEGWSARREGVDFFDLKGDLESLMAVGGDLSAWRFEPDEHPALHPGQTARVYRHERPVGWIGALHPAVRAELGLRVDAFLFEVRLDALTEGRLPAFTPLSRYPEVRRDLALVVEEDVPVQALLDTLREKAGEWLTDLRLFDVYQGPGVEKGRKSVALGLTWQHPSRTLNDDEINQLVDGIIAESKQRFDAELRG
ncbi:phenylalanine--tRNA ligase subunit beta [Halomonas sp. McH1-25]|uniref:phenylalanine--tRNA ligase subunit beta n=1 Tax=unclassified Halomonas TaxID=2609666 RepID=UPI001EF658B0|nr:MULTISPECIES: phenylalanine--tRNA ligase subunit beta [unclassified Halomonas]MCG7598547.1 phenylalanine--tRNA ligase subunit beta [Halomonas sp. McH1-25]MCP1341799.1 phenylalanine--tRNA ligase subunit beta [Halomonas sp. FL8]MCP1361016.1 phenylalanine--tRNA ligase subunit beta [Halomonas sp. BBD45]